MRIPSKCKRERPCHTILQPGFLNRYLRDSTLLSSSTLRIQFKNRGGRGIIGDVASLLRYLIPCSFMYSKHLSSLTIDCSSTNDFIIRSKSTSVKRILVNNKIINYCDLLASLIIMILKYQEYIRFIFAYESTMLPQVKNTIILDSDMHRRIDLCTVCPLF